MNPCLHPKVASTVGITRLDSHCPFWIRTISLSWLSATQMGSGTPFITQIDQRVIWPQGPGRPKEKAGMGSSPTPAITA